MHKEGTLNDSLNTFCIRVYCVRTIYVNENLLFSRPYPVETLFSQFINRIMHICQFV